MNALGIEVMLIDDLATLKLVHCDLGVLKLDEVSLLVREEDRVGATEALELRGWRLKSGNIPLPGLPASMQTLRYEHDGIGRIALRTCLLPPPCLPFGNVWETATMGEIGSLAVRVPALAEHLPWALMACVSPTGASTLVRLASVVILINSAGALDWDQFVKIVRENRAVQLAATALAELDRFVPLPAVIPALLAAAPATAAECRYSEARVRGGVRHDWALFKLLRERGDLSIQRSNMSFSYFLMCSRGGGTIIGTLRWAGRAIRQRLT
jgi:hypothetical protein